MSGERGVELVPVPDGLRRKALVLDGSIEEGREEAVARAEAAASRLAPSFDGWMEAALERLAAAVAAHREAGGPAARAALFRAAHELRGQAGQLGYPHAGRICGGLARLAGSAAPLPPGLAESHVEAVRAMVRERARGEDAPVAAALAAELERLCEEALKGPA